jgi:hypothetical protein
VYIATIRFKKFAIFSALHTSSIVQLPGYIFFFISTWQLVLGLSLFSLYSLHHNFTRSSFSVCCTHVSSFKTLWVQSLVPWIVTFSFWIITIKQYTVRTTFFLFVRWDFGYCGRYWPILPAPDDRWRWLWRNLWNEDWQGKPKYSYPSATLSTTNPTWLDPGSNPGRHGGKPGTNRLSYGAALGIWIVL